MDELLEFVFEIVFDAIGESLPDIRKKKFSVSKIEDINNRESYIAGLIATTLSLSYIDDKKLDKHEKKMINDLLKTYHYELTKKTIKNIKYLRRHKINLEQLKLLYIRLNIDAYTIIKITDDLDSILRRLDKNTSLQRDYLSQIRSIYQDKFYA